MHRVFEGHAEQAPDRIAVTSGADQLTYAELNARANRFAHYLISLGVGPGSVIGVCLDRTVDLMVSILGILKSGAAYLPLDPTYPQERLTLMLSQLQQIQFNVASHATTELVGHDHGQVLDLDVLAHALEEFSDQNPKVEMRNEDHCYVVFTSGSTGTPKATAVRHSGWYNLLDWLRQEYQLDHRSSGLSVSAFGFDISQRGLMAPLFVGATLHLLPSRSFDPMMAYRLIETLGVKTMHCAPSTLYVLIDQECKKGTDFLTQVDYVFIGGEPLNVARVEEWATRSDNRCGLLHQYGVAECTDVASSHRLSDYARYRGKAVPTGAPVYNTEIRLLNAEFRQVPDGEVGEICITGASVSSGYLNASAVDARRFTELDFGAGLERVYRTGDLGYATPQKELVVVGRVDAQVKVRGMRIDLGDVEHAVRARESVRDVVVLALPDESKDVSLIAFVVPRNADIQPHELRTELLQVLPRNMVPQTFLIVDAFPLNPNGKVDRLALSSSFRP
ncbi:MAG: amino acid adenylation domain-containing protein [Jatrophihabitantaceae bacterium]